MILSIIASLAISLTPQAKPLSCPIMGSPVGDKAPFSDYNGVRVSYCCAGCDSTFEKAPKKSSEDASKKGMTYGVFLFDPVTGDRLEPAKAIKESSDYNGVRFMFAKADNKAKFDADPKKYGALPEKEALFCPVGKEAVPSYGKASGYVDHEGVRYYLCCAGCGPAMKKDPAKLAVNSKDHVKVPGIATDKAAK